MLSTLQQKENITVHGRAQNMLKYIIGQARGIEIARVSHDVRWPY